MENRALNFIGCEVTNGASISKLNLHLLFLFHANKIDNNINSQLTSFIKLIVLLNKHF